MKQVYILLFATLFVLPTYSLSDAMRIKITAPNDYKDETIVRFLAGATENFDSQYDAWKLFSNSNQVPSLWTELQNGNPISINAHPELNRDYTIDLYTWINNAGNHSIQIEELGAFANNVTIYLYDKTTTQLWELQDGDSISLFFNTNIDSSARLQLIFSLPMEVNQVKEACNGLGSEITISDIGAKGFSYLIQDTQNNIVASGDNINDTESLFDLPPGNYDLYVDYSYNLTEISSFSVTGDEITAAINTSSTSIKLSEGGEIDFLNNSTGANQYIWSFGDSTTSNEFEPTHTYTLSGEYTARLIAITNSCTAMDETNITVINDIETTNINEVSNESSFKLLRSQSGYYITNPKNRSTTIEVIDLSGKVISSTNSAQTTIPIHLNPKGLYILSINNSTEALVTKILN